MAQPPVAKSIVPARCLALLTWGKWLGLLLAVLLARPSSAAAQWRLEGWFGDAYNARTSLTLSQAGEPDIVIDADWSTRPWRPTWYYSVRVAHWSGNSAWAFETMHHKLYLDNPQEPDVAYFRLTNGVNNILLERLWRAGDFEFGVGGGITLVVPISAVRGKEYNYSDGIFYSRYEYAGVTAYATVSRRFKLIPRAYGSLALKTTVSRLNTRIADGFARTNNFALHLQWGISLQDKK